MVTLTVLGVCVFVFTTDDGSITTRLTLAKWATPTISWLLEWLQPMLATVVRVVNERRQVRVHTGLYEKSDVVALLERQKNQVDNRISLSEIDMLEHALTFGDRLVGDVLIPQRAVHSVAASEHIGPVLMDELSKSGHSRFPVYDQDRGNIVGILYLHELVSRRQTGTVADVMSHKLTYVHEDFTLYQTLQAFLRTKQQLFLVVNGFEELVGIITVEDIVEQIIGQPIVDEFDRYDDLRAVAAATARQEHTAHQKDKSEVENHDSPEVTQSAED